MIEQYSLSIPIVKLKNGIHRFDFDIDNGFFESLEYSPIKEGNVQVGLVFDKRDRLFLLNFQYEGSLNVLCDRCLSAIDFPVSGEEQLTIKVSNEDLENEDDLWYIHDSETNLDVTSFVYDSIVLALPIKKTCDMVDKNCDHSLIEKMEKLNEDSEKEIDPRWEKLRNLKFKE